MYEGQEPAVEHFEYKTGRGIRKQSYQQHARQLATADNVRFLSFYATCGRASAPYHHTSFPPTPLPQCRMFILWAGPLVTTSKTASFYEMHFGPSKENHKALYELVALYIVMETVVALLFKVQTAQRGAMRNSPKTKKYFLQSRRYYYTVD